MAGFYFIRDKFPSLANGPELPGLPYPAYDGIIPLNLVRELPLAIQDRSFTDDSQVSPEAGVGGWGGEVGVCCRELLLLAIWDPSFTANLQVIHQAGGGGKVVLRRGDLL